jgi:hypothetical protein
MISLFRVAGRGLVRPVFYDLWDHKQLQAFSGVDENKYYLFIVDKKRRGAVAGAPSLLFHELNRYILNH